MANADLIRSNGHVGIVEFIHFDDLLLGMDVETVFGRGLSVLYAGTSAGLFLVTALDEIAGLAKSSKVLGTLFYYGKPAEYFPGFSFAQVPKK